MPRPRSALLLVLLCCTPGSAAAAGIAQPTGAAGCVSSPAKAGCGPSNMREGASGVVVSPDGRNVYAISNNATPAIITEFARDANTGALTTSGCVSDSGRDAAERRNKCDVGHGLALVNDIAISPDGRTVYTVSYSSASREGQAVSVFRRDPASGSLDQLQCLAADPRSKHCTTGALQFPYAVAVTGDRLVAGGEALSTFDLKPDGTIKGSGRCVKVLSTKGHRACAKAPRDDTLRTIGSLTITGGKVYATSLNATYFTRSRTAKSQLQSFDLDGKSLACAGFGCKQDARGIEGATQLAGADGGLYVAADDFVQTDEEDGSGYVRSSAIGVFAAPSLQQGAGDTGCVLFSQNRGPEPTCARVAEERGKGLLGATSVGVSPDGRFVVAGFSESHSVALLQRDPATQALTPVEGAQGCLTPKAKHVCGAVRGMDSASDIAISPDNRNAYVLNYSGIVNVQITE